MKSLRLLSCKTNNMIIALLFCKTNNERSHWLSSKANKQKVALSHHSRKLDQANTKLTFVPLVFVVMRVWGSIRFLLGNVAHDYASSSQADWIVIMQVRRASRMKQWVTEERGWGYSFIKLIYCVVSEMLHNRVVIIELPGHSLLTSG